MGCRSLSAGKGNGAVVLGLLINTLHMPEAVEGALSILMVIAAAGFVVFDIGRAINPEFLKNIKTDK